MPDFLDANATIVPVNVPGLCGARFCPGVGADEIPNLQPPHPLKIQLLSGVFLALMVGAAGLVAFGADSLKRYEMGRKGAGSGLSGCRMLAVTLRHLMQPKQLLLLPITMFIGAEQAFVAVDFTAVSEIWVTNRGNNGIMIFVLWLFRCSIQSFVACGWGISRIGYVMICFGVANAIAAILAGGLCKCVGRMRLMAGTLVVHAALLVWMRVWIAVDNDYLTYMSMAALWGLVDGVWLVLVNCKSYKSSAENFS